MVVFGIASINEWTPAGDKRLREYLLGNHRDGAGEPDDEETMVVPDEEDAADRCGAGVNVTLTEVPICDCEKMPVPTDITVRSL